MMNKIEYRFLFDEDFLLQGHRRFRRQSWSRWPRIAILSAAWLVVIVVAIEQLWLRHFQWAALCFGLMVLLLVSRWIEKWRIIHHFKRSPYYHQNIRTTITSQGLHAIQESADTKLSWDSFTKARRMSDGILLFQGDQVYNWLPDHAMTSPNLTGAIELVKSNIEDFKTLEG